MTVLSESRGLCSERSMLGKPTSFDTGLRRAHPTLRSLSFLERGLPHASLIRVIQLQVTPQRLNHANGVTKS